MFYPILDSKARPVREHTENIEHLILNVLKHQIKFDVVRNRVTIDGEPMSDQHLARITMKGGDEGLGRRKEIYVDVLTEIAHKNEFNPVLDLLNQQPWDGKQHIKALIDTVTTTNTEYWETGATRWMLSYVARAVTLGEIAPAGMLVLLGAQGVGKSRWLRKLCPFKDLYTESPITPHNKDDQLRRTTQILWNADELDATTSKAEISSLKGFLTAETTTARRVYQRIDATQQNICSFAGSVNTDDFLRDATGSRRFLVFRVTAIDYMHTVDMQQVFAEAWSRVQAGEKTWFDGENIATIEAENEHYKPVVELHQVLYATGPSDTPMETMVLMDALYGDMGLSEKRPSQRAFVDNLRRMGYKCEKSFGRHRSLVWARPLTKEEQEREKRPLKSVSPDFSRAEES